MSTSAAESKSVESVATALGCRRRGESFLETIAGLGNVRVVRVERRREMDCDVFPSVPRWIVSVELADRAPTVEGRSSGSLEDAALLALVKLVEMTGSE